MDDLKKLAAKNDPYLWPLPTPFPYPDVEDVGRAQVGQDLAFDPKLRTQEDGRVVPEVRAEQRITPRVGAEIFDEVRVRGGAVNFRSGR